MKSSAKNIKLTSYDELFQNEETRTDVQLEKVMEIPLDELYPFKNHPFKVLDDAAMQDTVESVAKYGVLVPAIVRVREEGGYELISGHRRKRACELAGKGTMPVIVRELDYDAAIVMMVDSNLQREHILPSERALAYKMKLDAMRRQAGRPSKENSAQLGRNFGGKESREILAEQMGESKNQISRYVRLTELVPEIMQMVDDKKMAFNPAVELSYLKKEEQIQLMEAIDKQEATPSLSQAQRLKKFSQEGRLSVDVMDAVMSEEKKEVEKVVLAGDKLRKYFPKTFTPKQMEDTIIKLLEKWQRTRQQEQER